MAWERWRDENKANWEDRVPIHVGPGGYNIEALLADPKRLSDSLTIDAPVIGSVEGLDVVHLQCHIGTDTLGFARTGAKSVTGVDFSPSALNEARGLFASANCSGTFVETDVMLADQVLPQASFDLVYASVGAINWIADFSAWVRVAANLLRPGGRLYLRDVHPMAMTIDVDSMCTDLRVIYPYREIAEPTVVPGDTTYSGDGRKLDHVITNEWTHSIAEILNGTLNAGLEIAGFDEHYYVQWLAYPWMVETSPGIYELPEGRERLPFLFTLQARKPA